MEDRLEALNNFGDGLNEFLSAINYWENVRCETTLKSPFNFKYKPYLGLPQEQGPLGDCEVWVSKNMEKVVYKMEINEKGLRKGIAMAYRLRMLDTFFKTRFQLPLSPPDLYGDCMYIACVGL